MNQDPFDTWDRPRLMRAQSLPPIRSTLRVKSQFQSLRTRGLHRVSNVHKTVEFAFLEVREFPMILGDNPSCVEGPPVTIDWGFDPDTHFILDVATFERMRGRRRNTCDLVVPKHVRERWLTNCGVSKREIAAVVRQVRREKHSRMVSCHNQNMDQFNEAIEKTTSGIKKLFVFRKSNYEKSLEKFDNGGRPQMAMRR